MTDFKLTIKSLTESADGLAHDIVGTYGEDFNAPKEFEAFAMGGDVLVIARDVAAGDALVLMQDIERDFGTEEGISSILVSQSTLGDDRWHYVDLEGDEF